MSNPAFCGVNRAFVYEKGGTVLVGEIEGATRIRWNRIRDEISTAQVVAGSNDCCELMSGVEPVAFELHIERDGELVWCGPITRIEFEWDSIEVFAEDMLWVAKRRALSTSYNFGPADEGGTGSTDAVTFVNGLLASDVYGKNGDEWNMLAYLNPVSGPVGCDATTSRQVNAWSTTVWEELDLLAEDYGIDYTVVGRDIYIFDVNLNWDELPTLYDTDIAEAPRIVEYGNALATRFIRTDGSGYAGRAEAPPAVKVQYASDIDFISNQPRQSAFNSAGVAARPSRGRLSSWLRTAQRRLVSLHPVKRAVVIPANSTLLPSSAWDVNTIMPGSWFPVSVTHPCRGTISEYARLQEVVVEESGDDGEKVAVTAVDPPTLMVLPGDPPC